MTAAFRRHKRRKLKSEINVVPYIDVMLVLLIIFMVTAPMLNLGVDIELPQSNARPVETRREPIVVFVDRDNNYAIKFENEDKVPVDAGELFSRVQERLRSRPNTVVFVAGEGQAPYQNVLNAMILLQQAGVPRVGLLSRPEQTPR
jgi:biopolymer transport protein TolR